MATSGRGCNERMRYRTMLSHPNIAILIKAHEQCLLHKQVNGCQVAERGLDEDKEDPTEPVGEDCSKLCTVLCV